MASLLIRPQTHHHLTSIPSTFHHFLLDGMIDADIDGLTKICAADGDVHVDLIGNKDEQCHNVWILLLLPRDQQFFNPEMHHFFIHPDFCL
jgi:hypothetical protein